MTKKRKKKERPQYHRRRWKLLIGLGVAVAVIATVIVLIAQDKEPPPPAAIEISDWYDLHAVREDLAGQYLLMNDLDSAAPGYAELAGPEADEGKGWQPIGTSSSMFTGSLDGQGYRIEDLFINRPARNDVGIFGRLGTGGIVENVGLVNSSVAGRGTVGGLVGYNWEGTISNCYYHGAVSGGLTVGGLVGSNSGTVSNSSYRGTVTGEENAGGLAGYNNQGSVADSYAICNITCPRSPGGVVGRNLEGTVRNSFYDYDEGLINGEKVITVGALPGTDFAQWLAAGRSLNINDRLAIEDGYYLIEKVGDFRELLAFAQDGSLKFRLQQDLDLSAEPGFYIPYLAGEFNGNGHTISNLSFSNAAIGQVGLFGYLASGGRITGVGTENVRLSGLRYLGGLVGYNWEGTVESSYSLGTISGEWYVGGLVGYSAGVVSNSHSSGDVTGEASVGGLAGSNGGNVTRSYSTGNVSSTSMNAGGLVGSNDEGTVTDCYSTASVTCDLSAGGLVGFNSGSVSKCYSAGDVTGLDSVGGLVGTDLFQDVTYSFWDSEASGIEAGETGVPMPTAMMQQLSTFEGAFWDIIGVAPGETNPEYTWNIVDGESYPFLSWQSVA
jgi:hypothetical protein